MIMVPIGTSQELGEKVHELMNRRNTIADRSTRSTGFYVIAVKAVGRKEKSPGYREGKKRGGERFLRDGRITRDISTDTIMTINEEVEGKTKGQFRNDGGKCRRRPFSDQVTGTLACFASSLRISTDSYTIYSHLGSLTR
ncbi:hypothetical protein QLX08_001613 [Tetragonisca angustula]|uniref:Uncharacterized protein n=1 Tax=Tetragonisca angustula TaxID=166442 RepID=A0AAW1AH45_9HYME